MPEVHVLAVLKSVNLALAFFLELCLLAAVGYWGFRTGSTPALKALLGIGGPVLVAVFWGIFLAPRAVVALPDPLILILKVVLFGLGAAALFAAGRPGLAGALAILFIINAILMHVWAQ